MYICVSATVGWWTLTSSCLVEQRPLTWGCLICLFFASSACLLHFLHSLSLSFTFSLSSSSLYHLVTFLRLSVPRCLGFMTPLTLVYLVSQKSKCTAPLLSFDRICSLFLLSLRKLGCLLIPSVWQTYIITIENMLGFVYTHFFTNRCTLSSSCSVSK